MFESDPAFNPGNHWNGTEIREHERIAQMPEGSPERGYAFMVLITYHLKRKGHAYNQEFLAAHLARSIRTPTGVPGEEPSTGSLF